jgi:hypothetical protein
MKIVSFKILNFFKIVNFSYSNYITSELIILNSSALTPSILRKKYIIIRKKFRDTAYNPTSYVKIYSSPNVIYDLYLAVIPICIINVIIIHK